MNKISAVIVDDEKNSSETLNLLLKEFEPDVEVVHICHTVKNALETLTQNIPDLLFLDIEMPTMNGFELLKRLGENYPSQVVFTTAYNQYGLSAIEHNAIEYLLKPISIPRLHQAVEKARKRIQELKILAQARQSFFNPRTNTLKIGFPSTDGIIFVNSEDIIRCEALNNYTIVHLVNQKKMTITKTMGEIEALLPNPDFCRLHRSHLVNIKFIQKYIRSDGGYILMQDGSKIEISRRKKEEVLRLLGILSI